MNIIKFEGSANLPAYLNDSVDLSMNDEVVRSPAFPSLSIKGMKFTINRDGAKTVLTKPDDPDEVAQHIGVVFLRANMNAKTFYAKKYSEGDSDGARPDCYSFDGDAPSPHAPDPQSKKCHICPHNQWGSRIGDGDRDGGEEKKGKACQDNARIAVSAPDKIEPMLLRVPPKSLKPLRELFKAVKARKYPYNSVVVKLGFDRNEPSPVLTFKPVGLMDDAGYAKIKAMFDDELVRGIVGLDDTGHTDAADTTRKGSVDTDELDAAIAARDATRKAAEKAKAPKVDEDDIDDIIGTPKAAPKEEPKPEPKKAAPKTEAPKKAAPKEYDLGGAEEDEAPKAVPKKDAGSNKLLDDLDDLLGNKDD